MKIIRVGIVSFGYMGKMHAMCYDNIKYYYNLDADVQLYAVVTSKTAEQLPVKFERIYRTVDELLEDEMVDIVDICSPNYMHRDVLLNAIQKGKHIYCEKPLARNLAEADEILGVMQAGGYHKTNRVVFEYRFVPAILRAKQMIEEGRIGRLVNFNFKYYGSEFVDPNRPISWQSTKELSGGGVLFAMGTHSIDLIRYLVGEVESVSAMTRTHYKERPLKEHPEQRQKVEIEDLVNVQMTCRNDVIGTLLLSQVAPGSGIDFTFEIYGEKGTLKFDHTNPNVILYFDHSDPKEPIGGLGGVKAIETTQKYGGEAVFPPPRVNIAWSRYHIASVYDMVKAVTEGKETHPNLIDGYRVQQIAEAIYRSAEQGTVEIVGE